MLKIMAEKINKLKEWGVLKKPEEIGVVQEFVLPSMLTPKSESGEWRLVTDFTALNIHIKKLQTVTPTISEIKGKLAKFKSLIYQTITIKEVWELKTASTWQHFILLKDCG